jgi:hypothetical protein
MVSSISCGKIEHRDGLEKVVTAVTPLNLSRHPSVLAIVKLNTSLDLAGNCTAGQPISHR